MKSDRQLRAQSLAKRFKETGRKPVVLEFAGVPKAGKTTTLGQIQAFLKRCGFRVSVVVERASVCPIRDKKHANFNIWTTCTTLSKLLENTQSPPRPDDPDVLILDRGLFDSLCWLTMMVRLSRLRREDLRAINSFLRLDEWKKKISAVFVMVASPKDSLMRERGYLPVTGAAGSIMNPEVLDQVLKTTRDMAKRLQSEFRINIIDTSSKKLRDNAQATAEHVADIALDVIEEQLREDILCIPKVKIASAFSRKVCLKTLETSKVLKCFQEFGRFQPREEVEKDANLVQAIPVVIVRNRTGDILQLRRREASYTNPLHEKLVIWAGGHVRSEDGTSKEAILRCAVREIQEELCLSIEPDKLKLLGSVYVRKGERTSKHAAIVYEWRADTDDVAVALSNAEFFERRGNSLSGRFVSVNNLVRDISGGKVEEVWSQEIVREFIVSDPSAFPLRLFE
ncbi:MAG: NUDIX domain-containing protein [Nitrospirae bacterium]|nr:MAG: NUDIX domain-containing protein [Nitrospirota bacterium]